MQHLLVRQLTIALNYTHMSTVMILNHQMLTFSDKLDITLKKLVLPFLISYTCQRQFPAVSSTYDMVY